MRRAAIQTQCDTIYIMQMANMQMCTLYNAQLGMMACFDLICLSGCLVCLPVWCLQVNDVLHQMIALHGTLLRATAPNNAIQSSN